MAGESFEIDIDVSSGGVEPAAVAVARLAQQLTASGVAASAAAEAVKTGEAAYLQAEAAADRAAKSVERIGLSADAQRGKLQAALDVGDLGAVERAASKLNSLTMKQVEAAAKAHAAKSAMTAEAEALDRMKASASSAAAAETQLSKTLDASKKAAESSAKAKRAAAGSGNLKDLAEGFSALGGPLGGVAQKAGGAVDAFKKMGASLGAAGPYVAAAAAVVAIAAAIAMVTAAAVAGVVSIAVWAVRLADTDGVLKKLSERLSKNFNRVFSGLKIQPLLAALDKIVSLFDEGSESAKAMSAIFESLFQPLIDGAAAFIPKIIAGFIQFEIMVMKAMIAIKPFGSTIVLVAQVVGVAILAVVAVFAVLAVAIVGMAAVAGALVVGLAYLGVTLTGLAVGAAKFAADLISGPGGALDFLKLKFTEIVAFLSSINLGDIGRAMIDGLIAGITGASAGVLTAMTGAVSGAVDGAKSLLGIASPSKVFAEIGTNTGLGMVEGIDGSAANVQGSFESMVSPPAAEAAPTTSGSSEGGGGRNFSGAIFNFYGVEGAEDALDRFLKLIEGDEAQMGLAVPNA